MRITLITLFPEAFPGLLGASVVGRGLAQGLWSLNVVSLRSFATDKRGTVDDAPYAGGAGMVLKPDVVAAAIRAQALPDVASSQQPHTIYLAPHGTPLTQARVRQLAAMPHGLTILCGHYEGVDERVLATDVHEVLSVGDFVLSGGEPAAVCLIDAVVRLLPGVLGGDASLHEESFDLIDPQNGELLVEYPHYTRPAVWEGHAVPDVLQQGNHAAITTWRLQQSRLRTKKRLATPPILP